MSAHSKSWDVVVAGDLFIDIVMSGFSSFPRPGQEAFAQQLRREIGGGAAITSSALARLNLKVAALGSAGLDDTPWLVDRLTAAGVDTSALKQHPTEPTGMTVSVSTPQDRAFYTYYGANECLPRLLKDRPALDLMAAARHVHFAFAPDPALGAGLFAELHQHGCRVSIDVGWHESWLRDHRSLDLLRQADLFLPNEQEAQAITGEREPQAMLDAFARRGLRNVALKLGASGAMLAFEGKRYRCPAYPVTPLDTTGAGDCFNAGFLYAWLGGERPECCLQIAAICGALSTRALGGVAAFPNRQELEHAMETVQS